MDKIIKIVLAILLFLCLLHFPYGYYVFVRLAAMIGFGVLAYFAYAKNQNNMAIVFVLLAILFQPFEKIALGRTLWNIVDVIIGIVLLISPDFDNASL
jgi:hypothetical protein